MHESMMYIPDKALASCAELSEKLGIEMPEAATKAVQKQLAYALACITEAILVSILEDKALLVSTKRGQR